MAGCWARFAAVVCQLVVPPHSLTAWLVCWLGTLARGSLVSLGGLVWLARLLLRGGIGLLLLSPRLLQLGGAVGNAAGCLVAGVLSRLFAWLVAGLRVCCCLLLASHNDRHQTSYRVPVAENKMRQLQNQTACLAIFQASLR